MLKELIYLFLTDLSRNYVGHDYKSYAQNEPGYGQCMLQAYISAFKTPKTGFMSEKLIKDIHLAAMRFSPLSNPGQYKKSHNQFSIAPALLFNSNNQHFRNANYSVTSKGLEEFLCNWILNDTKGQNFLAFENKLDIANFPAYLFEHASAGFKVNIVEMGKGLKTFKIMDYEEAINFANKLISNIDYNCIVNPMAGLSEDELSDATSQSMQIIISGFNKDIQLTNNTDEKIECIVKYVQRITQLHPFSDGNIRTCYILLNKLLRDHDLSLTILMNPNRLDACAVSELVQMVKQGQNHFQQIINHVKGKLVLEAPDEMLHNLKFTSCLPQILHDIDESCITLFINCVIKGNLEKIESFANNPHRLMAERTMSQNLPLVELLSAYIDVKAKENEQILMALQTQKYSLALRIACASYSSDVIGTLLHFKPALTFNLSEKSSNGNTAIDWLAKNEKLTADQKNIVINTLLLLENHTESSFNIGG